MLFYFKSGVNQYAGQKTLTDVFWAILPYYLGMLLHVFIKRKHLLSKIVSLLFCSEQYRKKNTFSNTEKERLPIVISLI